MGAGRWAPRTDPAPAGGEGRELQRPDRPLGSAGQWEASSKLCRAAQPRAGRSATCACLQPQREWALGWAAPEGKQLAKRLKGSVVHAYRKDRITVQEREAEALKQKELEQEAKRMAEERRKYTLKVPRGWWGSAWGNGWGLQRAELGPASRSWKRKRRRSWRRTNARWQHWMLWTLMMRMTRRSMRPGKYVS